MKSTVRFEEEKRWIPEKRNTVRLNRDENGARRPEYICFIKRREDGRR
jgi:hypothetical protein